MHPVQTFSVKTFRVYHKNFRLSDLYHFTGHRYPYLKRIPILNINTPVGLALTQI